VAVAVAVMLCTAACRPSHWVSHACEWSAAASPARDAIAFFSDTNVVLRRVDGDHQVAFAGCLAGAKDAIKEIVALEDGWSAFVYGYRVRGGNFFESGSVEDQFACIVDFRARTSRTFDVGLIQSLRHAHVTAGERTGWLYIDSIGETLQVIDVKRGVSAELENAGQSRVEVGTTTRVIRRDLKQTDPAHPIYQSTLVINDYDASVWPPVLRGTRSIVVGGRTDRVVVSADGKWAAYDGSPYYVGMESQGPVGDLGLVDLATGNVVFEQLARPGSLHASDIVVRGGRPYVLVAARPDPYGSGDAATGYWLDDHGAQVGGTKRVSSDRVTWLPAWSRVVVDASCDLDLVALPPP
jgi:hypothetical protein